MVSNNPHYLTGRQHFEAKEFDLALELYTKALESEENPSIYSERAVTFFHLKRLDESLEDMNYALSLEPENPYRYSSRAYVRDKMGDVHGAIEDYEKAVELDPDDSIAHNNLGMLQEKLGYMKKAKHHFSRADILADVDKLLEEARDDYRNEVSNSHLQTEMADAQTAQSEANAGTSVAGALWKALGTKAGWKAYWNFLKNGMK